MTQNRVALIRCVRNKRIIIDSDLASLYGVPTKRLNEQLRRNFQRFPEDFAFQLTTEEWVALRSQIATLKPGRGGHRKYAPYAFTEHGTLMAANILNSPRDIYQKLRPLLEPPPPPAKPPIGFHVKEDAAPYRIARRSLKSKFANRKS